MLTKCRPLLLVAFLASATLLVAACAPPVSGLTWVECSWASLEASPDPRGNYDRAALLIPVAMGGAEVFLQLDTGATSSWLYKNVVDGCGLGYEIGGEISEWPSDQGKAWHVTVRDFSFSLLHLELSDWLLIEEPYDPARAEVEGRIDVDVPLIAGSLGADMFHSGCLVLDLLDGRVAFSERAPALHGTKVPLTLVGGRPVFHLGGGVSLRALFDTGCSAFGLVCRPFLFAGLAGRDAGWTLPVTVVGGVDEIRGARFELDVMVGQEVIRLTEIYTMDLMDALHEATDGTIEAIVGNELFRDRLVAVDFAGGRLIIGPTPADERR